MLDNFQLVSAFAQKVTKWFEWVQQLTIGLAIKYPKS